MKKTIKLLLVFICQSYLMGQTLSYTASTEIIANPERGLQKYAITGSDYATTTGVSNLSVATLNNWKSSTDKVSVVYRYFMLDDFINSDINATYLANIQDDFDHVREAGFKIIVRFAYSDAITTAAQQPSKSQILAHISQLSSILTTNKDVIFSLQAGFIGTWGEWYYTNSDEFGTEGNISTTQWANRKEILDAMLNTTPADIPVQVRYVGIKTTLYGSSSLDESTAYQNTANARMGFYNDAFLNNYGDQGTYAVSSECENPVGTTEYNYLANETKYLPMTGETNGLNPCNSGVRTGGENAIYEMGLTHWTTLNRDYHTDFWNNLTSDQYNEILKKLGYRFVLNSSTITANTSNFDLTLDITNEGFARPFKERDVYLVMKNVDTNEITTQLINTDIRTWESTISITQNFSLSSTGTYHLYLWMPDNNDALENDSDYSIQLANENLWDSTTGYNDLQQTVNLNTLGVTEVSEDYLAGIYPNPASDFIHIQLKDNQQELVKIYNTAGTLVKEISVSNHQKIDISDLSNGVYFVHLIEQQQSFKLIKK